MRTVNRRGIESMAVMLYHSAVRDRRRSLRIILNTHRVTGWFRIRIDIRFTEQLRRIPHRVFQALARIM
jgi:hypothetical protein